MAKKVKSKKAAARNAPSVTPTYLPKGQTYTIGLHDLVRALKVIEKHGHTAKFARAAKGLRAAGTFDAKTVNFIKDFMAKKNMHTDPIGKHIVFNRNFELPGASAIRGLPGTGGTPGLPQPKRK